MIVLSSTIRQTLEPGQSITFNHIVLHSGDGECHKHPSDFIRMKKAGGMYEVHFGANVSVFEDGDEARLNITVEGETLLETEVSATTPPGKYDSVSVTTVLKNPGMEALRVINTGSVPCMIDSRGLRFYVKRVS